MHAKYKPTVSVLPTINIKNWAPIRAMYQKSPTDTSCSGMMFGITSVIQRRRTRNKWQEYDSRSEKLISHVWFLEIYQWCQWVTFKAKGWELVLPEESKPKRIKHPILEKVIDIQNEQKHNEYSLIPSRRQYWRCQFLLRSRLITNNKSHTKIISSNREATGARSHLSFRGQHCVLYALWQWKLTKMFT